MKYKSETTKYTTTFYPVPFRGRDFDFASTPVLHEDKRIILSCRSYGYHSGSVGTALIWVQP